MAREDRLIQRWRLAGAGGALAIPLGVATADFVGASFEVMDFSPDDGTTYRIYLEFDDPADQLLEVGGNQEVGAVRFLTNTIVLNNGGAFVGLKQEDFPGWPITGMDDSWVAMGATTFATNEATYNTGFIAQQCGLVNCICCSSWSDSNDGWFDSDPSTPTTPDERGRIVIAQFTVRDHVSGTHAGAHLEATARWVSASGALNHTFFEINATTCPPFADLDGSGVVDFGDVLRVLAAWGPCDGCPEDLRGFGDVGYDDLRLVLTFWGACE